MDRLNYAGNMIRAADFIEKNIKNKIPVKSVAESAFMSGDHFWRIFKKLFGESIGGYIRKRRLTLIADRLASGRRLVTDLCFEFGFGSCEVLSRGFKRQFGVSPVNYCKLSAETAYFSRREKMTAAYIGHILAGNISAKPVIRKYGGAVLRGSTGCIKNSNSVASGITFVIMSQIKNILSGKKAGNENYIVINKEGNSMKIFSGSPDYRNADELRLKNGKYAVYIHRGPLYSFNHSIEYVFTRSLTLDSARNAGHIVMMFPNVNPISSDFKMELRVPL